MIDQYSPNEYDRKQFVKNDLYCPSTCRERCNAAAWLCQAKATELRVGDKVYYKTYPCRVVNVSQRGDYITLARYKLEKNEYMLHDCVIVCGDSVTKVADWHAPDSRKTIEQLQNANVIEELSAFCKSAIARLQ